jgi:predicted amidohydrolase YtcJ
VTTVFRGGPVFCSDAARSTASAVAVDDTGTIVAVGGDDEVSPYLERASEVVDLDGRLLVPGFIDAHVHPVRGGVEMGQCNLTGGASVAGYAELIGQYAATHPEREWILGGGWSMAPFPGGKPTRHDVDPVVSDRPFFLPNRDHHSYWANSRALELAGVDASTPDPDDGRIERDSAGEPTGLLHEGASHLIESLLPEPSQADYDEGLRVAQRYLHSLGIVGWQDAWVRYAGKGATEHEAYRRASVEGWLTARVRGALWWERSCPADDVADTVAELVRLRSEVGTDGNYRATSVKIMQDGVAETFTAAMLEPYLDQCGHATDNTGHSFLTVELLRQVVMALDAAGFQIHVHALGDRAVRETLDALAAARSVNGTSDLRHHLAHLQVVHPDDIRRFRQLGATATVQALWACHEPQMDDLTIPFLGERRSGWQYPFGDLFRDGACLAMGSDWPVSSPDPLQAIHTAVNRTDVAAPAGTPPLDAGQGLTLATALAAYTSGSAYINGVDDRSGTIAPGMTADLVVLDRNPFDGPVSEIGLTTVDRTYINGTLVFSR